ncbi:14583_t:CDS:2, partial [Racocetra fulgida]
AKNIKHLETYCFPTCPDNVEEFLVKLQPQISDSFAKRGVLLLPEYSDCWNLEQAGCSKWNAIVYQIGKGDTYQKWKKKMKKCDSNRDLLTDEIDYKVT